MQLLALILAFLLGLFIAGEAAGQTATCPNGSDALLAGDHGEAVKAFTSCLGDQALGGKARAELHEERAVAYWLSRRLEEAIADYGEALALDLTADRYIKRGLLHFTGRDYGRALADYDRALDLAPRAALPHIAKALVFAWQDKRDEAVTAMDKGLDLIPAEALPDTVNEACWNFGLQGRAKIALAYCERGIAVNPRPIDHEALAFSLWQLGDLERARKELATAYVVSLGNTAYEPERRLVEFRLLLVQGLLTAHGYGPLPYGRNGAETEQALRAFQSDAKLTVDGMISDRVVSALKDQRPR